MAGNLETWWGIQRKFKPQKKLSIAWGIILPASFYPWVLQGFVFFFTRCLYSVFHGIKYSRKTSCEFLGVGLPKFLRCLAFRNSKGESVKIFLSVFFWTLKIEIKSFWWSIESWKRGVGTNKRTTCFSYDYTFAFQRLPTFSLEKRMSSWVLEGEVSAHLSPHEFYLTFSTPLKITPKTKTPTSNIL